MTQVHACGGPTLDGDACRNLIVAGNRGCWLHPQGRASSPAGNVNIAVLAGRQYAEADAAAAREATLDFESFFFD